MTTRTKKTSPTSARRSLARRQADQARTVQRLRTAVADVRTAEQDGLLYCASVRLAGRRTPWVQISPDTMALWWPYPEAPHVVLLRDVPLLDSLRILDWSEPEECVLIAYDGDSATVAAWLDDVFQHIYHCRLGYGVEATLHELNDA